MILQTQNVVHRFSDQIKISFPDIQLERGGSLLILGESGAGKTTLLHILGGLLKPSEGSVRIKNENLYKLRGSKLDAFRGDHIGMVFQQPHFIPSINAFQNISLTQKIGSNQIVESDIDVLFDRLNIAGRKNAFPKEMSQGERQRLAIARAFINTPKLVLADELTSALDDTNCASVISLLKDQSEIHDTSLVIVTHDQRLKDFFANSITLENWMV